MGRHPLGLRWPLCWGSAPKPRSPAPQLGPMMWVRTPGRPLRSASSPFSSESARPQETGCENVAPAQSLSLLKIWKRGWYPIPAGCMQAGWGHSVLVEVAARGGKE